MKCAISFQVNDHECVFRVVWACCAHFVPAKFQFASNVNGKQLRWLRLWHYQWPCTQCKRFAQLAHQLCEQAQLVFHVSFVAVKKLGVWLAQIVEPICHTLGRAAACACCTGTVTLASCCCDNRARFFRRRRFCGSSPFLLHKRCAHRLAASTASSAT